MRSSQNEIVQPNAAVAAHDPGGKVRLALHSGTHGDAGFSEDGKRRFWLRRTWTDYGINHFWLWIGMNPSTADASVDDPTIRREVAFTKREPGPERYYIKCNVMDYRATSPKALLAPGICPSTQENLVTILRYARYAEKIIVCHGALHKKLQPYANEIVGALRAAGAELWCLGKTANGSPRHPLYLRADTPLVSFLDAREINQRQNHQPRRERYCPWRYHVNSRHVPRA